MCKHEACLHIYLLILVNLPQKPRTCGGGDEWHDVLPIAKIHGGLESDCVDGNAKLQSYPGNTQKIMMNSRKLQIPLQRCLTGVSLPLPLQQHSAFCRTFSQPFSMGNTASNVACSISLVPAL